jgi:hypothetical protein
MTEATAVAVATEFRAPAATIPGLWHELGSSAAGAAVRRIDPRPRGVQGVIRAAFHTDDPGWGLSWDATTP